VVADDTGDPIVNARVTLVITGPAVPVVLTDHEGRFTLTAPSTRVTIAANKSGYSRHDATANATDPDDRHSPAARRRHLRPHPRRIRRSPRGRPRLAGKGVNPVRRILR